MEYIFINQTKTRLPKKAMQDFLDYVIQQLGSKIPKKADQLILVFVSSSKIKKLNSQFRKKNYPTDILSFDSADPESLGELVLCMDVLKKQAKEHHLSLQRELCYMLVHGVLHLLGYDHEKDDREAQSMYRLQDRIYNSYFKGN